MRTRVIVAAFAAVLILTGVGLASASSDSSDTAVAAAATARYHRLDVATDDGYGLFRDAAGIACIDMPAMPGMPAGAMGRHYANGALFGDRAIDASKPEALVYEPEPNGQLRLVALEYVVLKAAWDAAHDSPPSLFGHTFNFTDSGNRFGLPPYYSLHAWIWKHNPAGTFEMWNPEVSCAADPS
jgi:hypothetical protein